MIWKCPACGTAIRHSEAEEAPRAGVVYRCHVCRLELVTDHASNKLRLAAIDRRLREQDIDDRGGG